MFERGEVLHRGRGTLDITGHNALAIPAPPSRPVAVTEVNGNTSGSGTFSSSTTLTGSASQTEVIAGSSKASSSVTPTSTIHSSSLTGTAAISSLSTPPSGAGAVSSASESSRSLAPKTGDVSSTPVVSPPAQSPAPPSPPSDTMVTSSSTSAHSTTISSHSSTASAASTTSKSAAPTSTHSSASSPTSKAPTSTSSKPVSTNKDPTRPSTISSNSQVPSNSRTSSPSQSEVASTPSPSSSTTLQAPASPSQSTPAKKPTSSAGTGNGQSNLGGSPSSTGSRATGISGSQSTSGHSTLPKTVSLTLTSDGHTITTAPPLITSTSVSITSGGGTQTFTNVFANPSIAKTGSLSNDWDFFDNKGATAGVFIAAGVAILALLSGIFWLCRRRRRRADIRTMIFPSSRTREGGALPDMSERSTTYQAGRIDALGYSAAVDEPGRHLMSPSIISGGSIGQPAARRSNSQSSTHHSSEVHMDAGQAGIGALGLSGMQGKLASPVQVAHRYDGPFSDYHRYIPVDGTRVWRPSGAAVGIAISGDPVEDVSEPSRKPTTTLRPPSPTPSSPSIYPPSLPPVPEKDDDLDFYEQETQRRPLRKLPAPPPKAYVNDTNPINPFVSPLDKIYDAPRDVKAVRPPPRIKTGQSYQSLSPPNSSNGHSAASTPTAVSAESESDAKPINPFSNAFLGRPVVGKIEPLTRPARNPLRLSASNNGINGISGQSV